MDDTYKLTQFEKPKRVMYFPVLCPKCKHVNLYSGQTVRCKLCGMLYSPEIRGGNGHIQ